VLYVDDDHHICVVVQTALCLLAGMDVHTACSGEIAVDLAYEKRPDLIVLDVMMPGLDGPATYARIRESPLIADTPIIFMTAKMLPSEVAHLLGLGAIGVVGKPFDPLRIGEEWLTLWDKACTMPEVPDRRGGRTKVLAQVDALVEAFLERTRADIARIREFVKDARSGGPIELRQIERIAHSIHGAGAMFGFPAVSVSGGAIEHLAESLLMGPEPQVESVAALALRLDQLTDELSRTVAAARVTVPNKSAMFHARPAER